MTAVLPFPNRVKHDVITSISYASKIARETDPHAPGIPAWLKEYRKQNYGNILRGLQKLQLAEKYDIPTHFGSLYLKVIDTYTGQVIRDYGLVSCRVVTTVGVNFIVDAFQNIVEIELMKYHGIGLGTNAEAVGDTALQTELSTQYNPNSTRATGTQTENGANVYRSVGVNAVDASVAITEHGIFSDATPGSGVLLDRSQFAAVNLVTGNSLQSTWDLTLTAGS